MIPRLKPDIGWQELLAAWTPTKIDDIEQFESSFAKLMNVKYAVAFPYGRTGLMLLLKALGLINREVICPAYTCVVVPHSIVKSGNEPVFIDSQEYDFNMNLELVEDAINENTGAIIATSIFGYPVNLDLLREIRRKHPKIYIIQDCAHSFATEWKGQPVHKFGDASIFGLNISKLMTSIFGGMVTTDNEELVKKLYLVREQYVKKPTWKKSWQRRLYITTIYPAFNETIYGMVNIFERSGLLNRFVKYYDESLIDMPEDHLIGITRIESKVGQVQIPKYNEIIKNRRDGALFYQKDLQQTKNIILPPIVNGATYSHYVIQVSEREKILDFALKHGVQLGQLIEYCIPKMKSYKERTGNRYNYPVSSNLANTTVNLPIWVKQKDREKIVNVIREYINKGAR